MAGKRPDGTHPRGVFFATGGARRLSLGGPDVLARVDIAHVDQLATRIVSEAAPGNAKRRIDDTAALREWREPLLGGGRDPLERRVPERRVESGHPRPGRDLPERLLRRPSRRPGTQRHTRRARRIWQLAERFTQRLETKGLETHRQVAARAARLETARQDRRAGGGTGRPGQHPRRDRLRCLAALPVPAHRGRRGPGPQRRPLEDAARHGPGGARRHLPGRRHTPADLRQPGHARQPRRPHPGPFLPADAQLPHDPGDPPRRDPRTGRRGLRRPRRQRRQSCRVPLRPPRVEPVAARRAELGGGDGPRRRAAAGPGTTCPASPR